jgi:hypothetical protein
MGSGTDYLNVTQQPGFSLPPGATAIFTFRVALDPPQSGFTFRNGQTAIDVTVETLPSRTVIGLDPAAKAPVSVDPLRPAQISSPPAAPRDKRSGRRYRSAPASWSRALAP